MSFGEKLAKLRKEKGMSQEELAQELNVSRQAVSKWESNNSYPETEKIILICKLFNSSMDELIGLKETKVNNENKILNYINSFIDSFIKAIKMFYSMTFVQKIKCLIEMVFYGLFLLLIYFILGYILLISFDALFGVLPYEILRALENMFEGILYLSFLIIGIYILSKLYKIRYLDYYEESKKEIIKDNSKVAVKETTEKVNLKEEKIIIRDANKDFEPFSWLKKLFVICIKIFAAFISIPFTILFVFLLAAIIFVLYFINKGIILLYVVLGLTGGLLFIYILLEILIKFIFRIELKPKKLFVMFILSLIIVAISGGLFASEISTYKLIQNNELTIKDSEVILPMKDNLIIGYLDFSENEIIFEDREDILIEFYVSSDLLDVYQYHHVHEYNYKKYECYDYYVDYLIHNNSISDIINFVLENINKKEIIISDYSSRALIHISLDNYNKIKQNMHDYDDFDYE